MSTNLAAARSRSGWFSRLIGRTRERDRMLPLYRAIVGAARDPLWYRDGQVPDTVTGRFDMLSAVTALVLVRMERLDEQAAKRDSVLLTELFIADMDESLLELGVGDYSVGKHVGRMVGALGGRLTAFREASNEHDFTPAVHRNIFHATPPSDDALALVAGRLASFDKALADQSHADLVDGRLPKP
ncbi:MAG: ubiquinol-cytochrome C chaperone family protein [Allosphingosinicella sp.]|uniref:ubiquinol-cytochrome C chaperone family protein n=1 Tax=Allosphingosinicella sp. TaxID=2823234 RepID=UPI00394D7791